MKVVLHVLRDKPCNQLPSWAVALEDTRAIDAGKEGMS